MDMEIREQRWLRDRLAGKLVSREIAYQSVGGVRSLALRDAEADAVADTIVAVFDLPLTPYGLREAVRTFIRAAGPMPSAASSAYHTWVTQVRNEVSVTLAGG